MNFIWSVITGLYLMQSFEIKLSLIQGVLAFHCPVCISLSSAHLLQSKLVWYWLCCMCSVRNKCSISNTLNFYCQFRLNRTERRIKPNIDLFNSTINCVSADINRVYSAKKPVPLREKTTTAATTTTIHNQEQYQREEKKYWNSSKTKTLFEPKNLPYLLREKCAHTNNLHIRSAYKWNVWSIQ